MLKTYRMHASKHLGLEEEEVVVDARIYCHLVTKWNAIKKEQKIAQNESTSFGILEDMDKTQ